MADVQKMNEADYAEYVKNKLSGQKQELKDGEEFLQAAYPGKIIEAPEIEQSHAIRLAGAQSFKYDEGKVRYDLVPPLALEALAKVYTMGAAKYSPRNWEKGMDWSKCYAAAQRHLQDYWKGEDLDPESGLPHLAHAAWNCVALLEYYIREIGTDDRPYPKGEHTDHDKNPEVANHRPGRCTR